MPTKDRGWLLPQAIDSVLSQDYPNIECIVVDAASTDNTLSVLKSYGDRIRWLSEPDKGPYDAINKGWALCHGEIMTWLNADDRWRPGAVRTAVDYFLADASVDVLYGDCGAIDVNSRLMEVYPAREWDLEEAVANCDHIINQAASFMRREIVERVGYLYPAWAHDQDLWLRIAMAGGRFKAVRHHLADARIWADNFGSSFAIIAPAKVSLTQRFFARTDLPENLTKLRARAFSNSYFRAAQYIDLKRPQDYWEGFSLLARALLADPRNTAYICTTIGTRVLYNFVILCETRVPPTKRIRPLLRSLRNR